MRASAPAFQRNVTIKSPRFFPVTSSIVFIAANGRRVSTR
jgi:hypothetical protein